MHLNPVVKILLFWPYNYGELIRRCGHFGQETLDELLPAFNLEILTYRKVRTQTFGIKNLGSAVAKSIDVFYREC